MGQNEITVEIPAEPTAKGRPRFHVGRGYVQTHTPPKTKIYENFVADWYFFNCGKKFEAGVPLAVSLIFCMPVPKSTSKKRAKLMCEGYESHIKKPDIDNLVKAVLDALNGVAFDDDNQICELHAHKIYAETPKIVLNIKVKNGGTT